MRQRRRRRRCSVGDSDGDGSNRGTGGGVVCLEWQRRRDEVVVGRDEMMREMRMLRLVQRVEGAVQLVREMMVMVMMIAMVLVAAVAVNGGGFVTVGGRHSSSRQLRKRLLWLYLVRLLRWWGKLRWGLRQLYRRLQRRLWRRNRCREMRRLVRHQTVVALVMEVVAASVRWTLRSWLWLQLRRVVVMIRVAVMVREVRGQVMHRREGVGHRV